MVTVRTYWSLAKAALAKSLLDNYEIPCVLLDENAGLYNRGAQFAVPIRLVVDEREADRAILLLNGDFENAAEIESNDEMGIDEGPASEISNRNPWELLIMAFYFFVPSICALQIKYPTAVGPARLVNRAMAAVRIFHFIAWLLIIVAAFLAALYFYIRQKPALNPGKQPDHSG